MSTGNYDSDEKCSSNALDYHLEQARMALRHVKCVVWGGAGDKLGDNLWGFGFPFAGVVFNQGERAVRRTFTHMNTQEEIELSARRAAQWGAGNCGEQAAVAFIHLRDRNVTPIAYMSLANADHAFVLIGFGPNSQEWEPATWGRDAVICDPWMDQSYQALHFYAHMNFKKFLLRPEVEMQIPEHPPMKSYSGVGAPREDD